MKDISTNTLKRLPVYVSYLKQLPEEVTYVSATSIAEGLKLGDVQVRKDLATISSDGRPKTGYEKAKLIKTLEKYLGYDVQKEAVLVGAGRMGTALLGFDKFADYGLNIAAAFDADVNKVGVGPGGKRIYHMDEFADYCARNKVKIGIITSPVETARDIYNTMVDCGIELIWNFAPIYLPEGETVHVRNENMAVSLALLTAHVNKRKK